ncbi:MAG: hypothetical protein QXM60_05620 [Thermoplasmatales archaeon]
MLKDIESRLDFRCTIKVNQYDSVFNITRSFNLRVPVFISKDENGFRLNAYFPEKTDIPGLSDALLYFRARQVGNRMELTNAVGNEKLIHVLGPIIEIPSTSSIRVTAEKGKLVMRFRFHHSDLSRMSQIAKNAIEELSASVRIATPASMISLLHWYNEEIQPISVIVHRLPLKALRDEKLIKYLNEGILEFAYSPINPARKFVFYKLTGNQDGDDLTEISAKDHIYSMTANNEFITKLWEGFSNNKISRIYTFFKAEEDKFVATSFVPSEELDNFTMALFQSASSMGEVPEIVILDRYKDDIWNVL